LVDFVQRTYVVQVFCDPNQTVFDASVPIADVQVHAFDALALNGFGVVDIPNVDDCVRDHSDSHNLDHSDSHNLGRSDGHNVHRNNRHFSGNATQPTAKNVVAKASSMSFLAIAYILLFKE
jgi:hypothetical protein